MLTEDGQGQDEKINLRVLQTKVDPGLDRSDSKGEISITMGSRRKERNRNRTKDPSRPSQKKEVMERNKRYWRKGKTQKAIFKRSP